MKNWYSKEINEIYKEIETNEKGLSTKEAKERLLEYGKKNFLNSPLQVTKSVI